MNLKQRRSTYRNARVYGDSNSESTADFVVRVDGDLHVVSSDIGL